MKLNCPTLFAGICFLLFASAFPSYASAEDSTNEGVAVAQAWVGQIDAGQYDASYLAGCTELHDKVAQDKWVKVLQAFRGHWGAVMHREQTSQVFKPNGIEGLEGECLVIKYDTSFKNLPTAWELVVLKWEDGRWRGAGYNCGPKPVQPAEQTGDLPQAETTSTTTTTTKPDQ